MSGYLQRLASRAINPIEPVHPVLGSVFSPPKYGSEPEGPSTEREDFSSTRVESLHSVESAKPGSASSDSKFSGSPESSVTPGPQMRFRDSRHTPDSLVQSGTLLPPRAEQKPNPIFNASTSFTPSEPPNPHEAARRPEASRESDPLPTRRPQEGLSEVIYTPLIKENFAHRNNQETFRREAIASPKEMIASPGHPIADRLEPDEIQIHIGRIEVTAVPQTAARAVMKPARKGMSLEEYLSSRDRRA